MGGDPRHLTGDNQILTSLVCWEGEVGIECVIYTMVYSLFKFVFGSVVRHQWEIYVMGLSFPIIQQSLSQ